MKKKVIIIGAGVSGLSAGIYAQMNGFDSEIYEQHKVAGGECTAWMRKGYTIDGAISWLTGTRPETKMNQVWNEIGAFDNSQIAFSDVFAVIEMNGRSLFWYRDIERLRGHLCEISPADETEIDRLTGMISDLKDFEIPAGKPMDIMEPSERMVFVKNFMEVFQTLGTISSLNIEDYVKRFQSPLIVQALRSFSFQENLVQGMLITLGSIAGCQSGWLKGGSKKLTDNLRDRYLTLGGKLSCDKKVEQIQVEDGRAVGILLRDGTCAYADYLIPACDTYVTMKKLLGGTYKDRILDRFYTSEGYRTSSIVQVTFGVACDLSGYPEKMIHIFEQRHVAGEEFESCLFTHYCGESGFAPPGKSVVKTGLTVYHYEEWEHLSDEEYQHLKEEITKVYLELLYRYIPETRGKVEMVDVTTPLTYERYCGAYKGAYMAFMLTKETNRISHNGIVRGIKNMYIASQWLSALGGLPDAAVSGKNAIQRICSAEHLEFTGVQ